MFFSDKKRRTFLMSCIEAAREAASFRVSLLGHLGLDLKIRGYW